MENFKEVTISTHTFINGLLDDIQEQRRLEKSVELINGHRIYFILSDGYLSINGTNGHISLNIEEFKIVANTLSQIKSSEHMK